ncbi:MAG: asparagine--tRNA ligase [Gemmatimonadetes bacterium]|nr:asparagine--tRNA ligase [Gemmatimonadota bacterium]MYA43801.1 asparagine--tRNA ligase [Gemmatimonadota bacterium]MYE93145.1 asparagine--tRNA ligase [Gemmatimonadota bacterium]MYJ09441.1 asparagine--tRNA ligase [Gemmatimonadota bacterium]
MSLVKDLPRLADEAVTVSGWIASVRVHARVAFVVLRDGTGVVQGVVVKSAVPEDTWDIVTSLTQESCVAVGGLVREDARAPGGYELTVSDVEIVGASDEYPIQPKEHGVEFLLDHRHLWLRSSLQRAGLKVRAEVEQAIHDFLYERDFVRIDTPILTGAIGESAGTLFETDYFGERAFLAQTGQLYVESACPAFRKVYCFGPTFRAEKSKTRRHLTEFWMVEPEVAFADSHDNMTLQEAFVCYMVERALERCGPELEVLGRDRSRLESVVAPFPRISYCEAVERLNAEGREFEWGRDLGAVEETIISDWFDRPVFVYNYPKGAKAFYMKENPDDPRTVLCNDLLAPDGAGEIIGGSQREDDHDRLLARIREEGLPEEAYTWYLDLRKFGTFPHSGFGLGVERTVGWITGRPHIRELVPFPRLINRLTP